MSAASSSSCKLTAPSLGRAGHFVPVQICALQPDPVRPAPSTYPSFFVSLLSLTPECPSPRCRRWNDVRGSKQFVQLRFRPWSSHYRVRTNPCTAPPASTKIPTMIPPGFIPEASLRTAPGGSNDVNAPFLSRNECETPVLLSVYIPTISPSGLFPPANVKLEPGKSIVTNLWWYSR